MHTTCTLCVETIGVYSLSFSQPKWQFDYCNSWYYTVSLLYFLYNIINILYNIINILYDIINIFTHINSLVIEAQIPMEEELRTKETIQFPTVTDTSSNDSLVFGNMTPMIEIPTSIVLRELEEGLY